MDLPKIIQGGMGVGVSNWSLAQAVSRLGQLGVVSGTALDQVLTRRLQDGDPGGHMRRALRNFPFPRLAQRIMDTFFVPEGKAPEAPYKPAGMHVVEGRNWSQLLCVAANYVEVFLAREGHANPVGINYLEKISLPHLPSLYGAMLAGVAVVVVGAGIPIEFPGAIDSLTEHCQASYPIRVSNAGAGQSYRTVFDPAILGTFPDGLPALLRPKFLPIISADALATMLLRRAPGKIDGFIVEGPRAGGHNAPPRGALKLNAGGEPIYGPRDTVDLDVLRRHGVPFWLAGSCGSPESLAQALDAGAAGIQVGTAFALCAESGLALDVRRELVRQALSGQARVFTDPLASPTGFPFKVARLEGTLSEAGVYSDRVRRCDLGFLREAFLRADGTIGYRCGAEPVAAYLAKGGKEADTHGRQCLCNALLANINLAQPLLDGGCERCLVTLGEDLGQIHRFCHGQDLDYSAADVIRVILGA